MGCNFTISVKGKQLLDGHFEENELTTSCTCEKTENSLTIKYDELDENNKLKSCSTLVFEDSGIVKIQKENSGLSELVLEKGKWHRCNYSTEYGTITLEIFTKDIVCNLTENGGTAKLEYSLNANSSLLSENTVIINLKRS